MALASPFHRDPSSAVFRVIGVRSKNNDPKLSIFGGGLCWCLRLRGRCCRRTGESHTRGLRMQICACRGSSRTCGNQHPGRESAVLGLVGHESLLNWWSLGGATEAPLCWIVSSVESC